MNEKYKIAHDFACPTKKNIFSKMESLVRKLLFSLCFFYIKLHFIFFLSTEGQKQTDKFGRWTYSFEVPLITQLHFKEIKTSKKKKKKA